MGKQDTESSRKVYVLDTNVLIHNPDALLDFEGNDLVLAIQTIEELDHLKRGHGEIPYSARRALNLIDSFRVNGDFTKGFSLPGGGRLSIQISNSNYLEERTNDNKIVSLAKSMKDESKGDDVILVSKDTAVRIKASFLGVEAQDFTKDKTALFQKYGKILAKDDYTNGICSTRYQIIGDEITRFFGENHSQSVKKRSCSDISPKNDGQACALDALTNPAVEVVALTGFAGTGKTLLALAAALDQTTKTDPLFDQVLVARPVIPMEGQDLGFLPGDIGEKMGPWMSPIYDNLEVLFKPGKIEKDGRRIHLKEYQQLIDAGIIKVEALSYIRGRSLPKRYIIIDEAQNLRPLDVKTLVTRCGEGSKIVFTGDLGQIDTPYLDAESNGLAYLISRYINEPEFCYLNLVEGARSGIAEKGARLL